MRIHDEIGYGEKRDRSRTAHSQHCGRQWWDDQRRGGPHWTTDTEQWRCFYDGIVDAVEGSTDVTISNSYFTEHNQVMLFGASDGSSIDKKMQITVAFNHFGKRLMSKSTTLYKPPAFHKISHSGFGYKV
ncbi:hypothetical protein H5410_009505 [Solanum commersonii]|uniref:Pectate lyase domain-containing protein n=1 Tax=Solanum commersonii TaxID=4109 RepID=A0A9J6AJT8_SOLCO|nr:hypothetical protein H5410_009505 [Solanum commersonii]